MDCLPQEREELIEFWDGLDKAVFVLTGDLHNSFAIKITDNVYEFASGPHNSINHSPMKDEGGRPSNGKFNTALVPATSDGPVMPWLISPEQTGPSPIIA